MLANPSIRAILLLWWIPPALLGGAESLVVPYVAGSGAPHAGAGWVLAAMPAGMFLGDLIVGRFCAPATRERLVLPLLPLMGLPPLPLVAHLPRCRPPPGTRPGVRSLQHRNHDRSGTRSHRGRRGRQLTERRIDDGARRIRDCRRWPATGRHHSSSTATPFPLTGKGHHARKGQRSFDAITSTAPLSPRGQAPDGTVTSVEERLKDSQGRQLAIVVGDRLPDAGRTPSVLAFCG